MTKTFLFSLGWNIEPVLGTFTRHALRNGDEVIFVVPNFKDERTEKAIVTIKEHLQSLGLVVNTEIVEIPLEFEVAVKTILDVLERCRGSRIIVNISGGMRYVVLVVYTAVLLGDRSKVILDELTLEGRSQTVSLKFPPLIRYVPTPEEKMILHALEDGEKDINQLALIFEGKMTKTALWKKLNKLGRVGIVRIRKDGKRNLYSLQTWVP